MQYLLETNAASLPALNYLAFVKHYQVLQASLPFEFVSMNDLLNTVIRRVRAKESPENTIQNLENLKIGIAETFSAFPRAAVALACLCVKVKIEGKTIFSEIDARNDEELLAVANEIIASYDYNYMTLLQDLHSKFDKIQKELANLYPDLFPKEKKSFFAARDAIKNINLDDLDNSTETNPLQECLEKIQEAFIQVQQPIKLLSDTEDVFEVTYWREFMQLAESLDYKEQDLRTNSIVAFFAKNLNNKQKMEYLESVK